MFLSQLLPPCRCFSTRAALLQGAFPPAYSVQQKPFPRPTNPYKTLPITPQTWKSHPAGSVVSDIATGPKKSPSEIWRENSRINVPLLQRNQPADPYQGRTVKVKGSFAEASRELDRILSRNRVRFTVRSTERHEKRGVKRRRIKSEQWRKHFADQVRKNVQLVHQIRRRGV
ncbi:hypothetical protein C8R43DRAFT_998664 [Mycena crocata]|nr:hypothetical protein C8R43DRAFT_998664 [Mycena crocata]